MATGQVAAQAFTCVATGCGKRYDPNKTRAHLRGLCSQACQDALAKELGWRRSPRGRPTQYSVVKNELHRRRATVPGADTRDIVAVVQPATTAAVETAAAPDAVRAQHLADAFVHVARANHYMVGVVDAYTSDELDAAEQLLISVENAPHGEHAHVELALDIVEHAKGGLPWRPPTGVPPFAGLEPYYEGLFRLIKARHRPQGTGGDMSCLIAMVEYLWSRPFSRPVPGCPGCGTHDHAHNIDKHKASGIPVPQHAGQHWDGTQWVTP